MANVLKNRVLTLCDLAEQWGSIYKFFSFCDLSNLEVNYLHSCPCSSLATLLSLSPLGGRTRTLLTNQRPGIRES